MRLLRLLLLPVFLLAGLFYAIHWLQRAADQETAGERLVIFAAAGLKAPLDEVMADYVKWSKKERGFAPVLEVQYGGSGDLLARLQAGSYADLYLAADSYFMDRAESEGLVQEVMPLATMVPVIALSAEGAQKVRTPSDLLQPEVRVGIAQPDGTAIGQATRSAYERSGKWRELEEASVVTKTTVNELAMDLQIGSLDAAIIWDALAAQFGLATLQDPDLQTENTLVAIGVTPEAENPAEALRFARFLTAPDRGNLRLEEHHLRPVPGDRWSNQPEIIVFSGAINRNALAKVLDAFAEREGVRFQTTYNGCGTLTSQMKVLSDQTHEAGFPDLYIACDVYYMEPVAGHFASQLAVSETDIVLVTQPGNPKGIHTLEDLAKPGVRIVLGNPEFCTIGALTKRLLQAENLYDRVLPNVVEQTTSSALLVPAVVTGAADAVLAYKTDTLAEANRLETTPIDSPLAKAVQPVGASVRTPYPGITGRFYRFLEKQSEAYTQFGFQWIFGENLDQFEIVAPAAAERE